MPAVTANGIDELKALIGQEIGPSEWRTVTQELIDTFAEVSGDDQWIHVDVERAKTESPFGTTIAHGNLTLSMIDGFRKDLIQSEGFVLGVNYGWNKVRFPAPVPAGSQAARHGGGGLGGRRRQRLVPDRDQVHGLGRGVREARVRGGERRPGAARSRIATDERAARCHRCAARAVRPRRLRHAARARTREARRDRPRRLGPRGAARAATA